MYSPAARPSIVRAAPAKKRSWSIMGGISSSNVTWRGLPASLVSQSVISSARSWNASASFRSSSWRWDGVVYCQVSNAPRAAFTARSTSSSVESGACAMTSPFAGLITSSVLPSAGSTNSPPIMFFRSRTSAASFCCFSAVADSIAPPWSDFLLATEYVLNRGVPDADRFRNGGMRDGSLCDVDPQSQAGVAAGRLGDSVVRDGQNVGKRCVGQCVGRCDRHRAGHVGDAVVSDPVDLEDGIAVRGRMRGLEAATLIDRDVHQHSIALHQLELVATDDERRLRSVDQDRPDHQVGARQHLLDRKGRREDGRRTPAEGDVELAQLVDRDVEDEDVGLHPDCDERRVHPDGPSADDHHVRRRHARDSAEQDATAAKRLLEEERSGLRSDLARDLAHGCEQRQPALGVLDGLVGNAGGAALLQGPGELRGRREVQVGEERVIVAQHLDLPRLRLLDAQQQLGLLDERRGVGHHPRPLGDVRVIGDGAALARPCLDQNLVAVLPQLARTGRGQGDAVLVLLDLGWDADPHRATLLASGSAGSAGAVMKSKRTPRPSSSANISSGSMQLSGGSAPRRSIEPRASNLTAAAAGVAVETMPPPRPQARCGGVTLRARITESSPLISTMWMETVLAEGGEAERATSAIRSSLAPRSSFRLSSTGGDSESANVTFGESKLSPNVSTSEWRVKIVSASPIGSPKSTVGPACRGSSSRGVPSISAIGAIVISSSRVRTA